MRTSAAMSDRILDDHFLELRTVVELDGDGVGDRALVRVEVIPRKAAVFDADRPGAKRVDPRVGGDAIFVIRGSEAAEDQWDRDHVLDAMVAIRRVGERALLVDDANGRFVGAYGDPADRVEAVLDLVMERHRAFDRSLAVEFRRK